MQMIFPGLVHHLMANQPDPEKKLFYIRRGTALIMLSISNYSKITFLDAKNLSHPTTLDKFGKMWNADVVKGVFPYEMFSTVDEMRHYTEFPPIHNFRKVLSPTITTYTEEEYTSIVTDFQRQNNLTDAQINLIFNVPETPLKFPVRLEDYIKGYEHFYREKRNNSSYNFLDYCIHYNIGDTEVLAQALTNFIDTFIEIGANPLDHIGIPGVAQDVLYKNWNSECGPPMSFHEKHADIWQEFHDNIMGGLTIILCKRHAEIGSPDRQALSLKYPIPESVYCAKNGNPYKLIVSLDHNALYSYSMGLNLPSGSGFVLKKIENLFQCESMLESEVKYSNACLDWLNEIWHRPPFQTVHRIQHCLSEGEKEIIIGSNRYLCDGYAEIDGIKYVFEFNGCRKG